MEAEDIERRLALDNPFGQHLPHAARPAIALEREAVGAPHAANAGQGSEHWTAVGGVAARVAYQRDDLGPLQVRDAPNSAFQQRLEAIVVARKGVSGVVPRDAVCPPHPRFEFVAADDQAAVLLAQVHQVVRVSHTGCLVRQFFAWHRLERDVLMVYSCCRDMLTGHRRYLWAPHAGGVNDQLGADVTLVGQDLADLTPGVDLKAGDARVRVDGDAKLAGLASKLGGRQIRIQVSITRKVDCPKQAVFGERREELEGFIRGDDVHFEPDGLGLTDIALQLLELGFAGCQAQTADVSHQAELAEQVDAVLADLHQRRRSVELSDQAGRPSRFAAGNFPFLEQHDVAPTHLGQMVGDTHPHNPAADDNDASLVFHSSLQFQQVCGRTAAPCCWTSAREGEHRSHSRGPEGLCPPARKHNASWDYSGGISLKA